MKQLDEVDHIAVPVDDIGTAVSWYRDNFTCEELYCDSSWALLQFRNVKLALVLPTQHPGHFALTGTKCSAPGEVVRHRDGTESSYMSDPWSNVIEIMLDRNTVK